MDADLDDEVTLKKFISKFERNRKKAFDTILGLKFRMREGKTVIISFIL